MSEPKIIQYDQHPSNHDRTAHLVDGSEQRSIYRVAAGYIACLEYPFCVAGYFESIQAARAAQEQARPSN